MIDLHVGLALGLGWPEARWAGLQARPERFWTGFGHKFSDHMFSGPGLSISLVRLGLG